MMCIQKEKKEEKPVAGTGNCGWEVGEKGLGTCTDIGTGTCSSLSPKKVSVSGGKNCNVKIGENCCADPPELGGECGKIGNSDKKKVGICKEGIGSCPMSGIKGGIDCGSGHYCCPKEEEKAKVGDACGREDKGICQKETTFSFSYDSGTYKFKIANKDKKGKECVSDGRCCISKANIKTLTCGDGKAGKCMSADDAKAEDDAPSKSMSITSSYDEDEEEAVGVCEGTNKRKGKKAVSGGEDCPGSHWCCEP